MYLNYTVAALREKSAGCNRNRLPDIIVITRPMHRNTQVEAEMLLRPFRKDTTEATILSNEDKIIICALTPNKGHDLLGELFGKLKDANSQFSGNRFGIIAFQIDGVLESEWAALKGESGLSGLCSVLLNDSSKKHIAATAFLSDEIIRALPWSGCLAYFNPACKYNYPRDMFNSGQNHLPANDPSAESD